MPFFKCSFRGFHSDTNTNLRKYGNYLLLLYIFFLLLLYVLCTQYIFSLFHFCNLSFMCPILSGCLCDDPYCTMTSEELFHLPLNVYIIILGIGLFILMLTLIFCCYLFRYNTTDLELQYGIHTMWLWQNNLLNYMTSVSMFQKIIIQSNSSPDNGRHDSSLAPQSVKPEICLEGKWFSKCHRSLTCKQKSFSGEALLLVVPHPASTTFT